MILNHKEAIQYVVDNLAEVAISRRDLFNIHALLADGLLADPALAGRLRRMLVGIAHSSYRPIDNRFVIEEEFEVLVAKATAITDPFEQAFSVRQSVLEWKTFRPDDVKAMAVEAGIPEADRQGVVDYVGNEIRGLHEGNAIRYRLRPEDLSALSVS